MLRKLNISFQNNFPPFNIFSLSVGIISQSLFHYKFFLIVFYDNENGFVKVAEIFNNKFTYTNGYRPQWIVDLKAELDSYF